MDLPHQDQDLLAPELRHNAEAIILRGPRKRGEESL